MTDLEELQKALDNRPKYESGDDLTGLIILLDEWFEDFARKFATYRASLELPVGKWLTQNAKTYGEIGKWIWQVEKPDQKEFLKRLHVDKWVSVPEIQPRLMKLVQEGDDNKLLVIQAVTKLRAKEEQLEGKVLIDRKQLSDLMKRQPLPEAFRWISDFKSQYVHWTKKLKELLEK